MYDQRHWRARGECLARGSRRRAGGAQRELWRGDEHQAGAFISVEPNVDRNNRGAGSAEQGGSRRECVRARSGNSPGRDHQESADVRDYFAADGRCSGSRLGSGQAFGTQRVEDELEGFGLRPEPGGACRVLQARDGVGGSVEGNSAARFSRDCARSHSTRREFDDGETHDVGRVIGICATHRKFAISSSDWSWTAKIFLESGKSMKKTIVLLPGDGIGPEVTRAAATVLREAGHEFHHQFEFQEFPVGGAAIDAAGVPLPNETLDACRKADAIFLGAVGGSKWDSLPVGKRPESGLLALRQGLGLFVNLRPVKLLEPLRLISPLKPERLGELDIEIVRELAGGMYFGERGTTHEKGVERAFDTESYSTPEIERVAKFAYARAEVRSRRMVSVDKANVLASSQLWRRTVVGMNAAHPDVRLEHMYVDNAAMQLTLRPAQFDVMLTTNMFGDILSDAAAALVGSIGLIPSASFGSNAPLFEPIHGSAPNLVGTDSANPIGSILSATMMLRDAFGLSLEADWVEQSLHRVLSNGYRTADTAGPGGRVVGGSIFTEMLREEMQRTLEHAERYGWGV